MTFTRLASAIKEDHSEASVAQGLHTWNTEDNEKLLNEAENFHPEMAVHDTVQDGEKYENVKQLLQAQ